MCSGFRHKDWEGLLGFLLAFWPRRYRGGPHISHCCYIKDPQDLPKFSLLIFTFVKFPPTVEWFTACKSQWVFASASKESLPLHLYLHIRFPSSSASCPAPWAALVFQLFLALLSRGTAGLEPAGRQARPLRTHNLLSFLPLVPPRPSLQLLRSHQPPTSELCKTVSGHVFCFACSVSLLALSLQK